MTANFYPHRARAPAAGGLQPRMVEWTAAWWLLQTSLTHTLTTHTLAHITVTASSLVHQRCLRHSPKQGSDANEPLALPVKLEGLDLGPMHHRPPPTATSHEELKTSWKAPRQDFKTNIKLDTGTQRTCPTSQHNMHYCNSNPNPNPNPNPNWLTQPDGDAAQLCC